MDTTQTLAQELVNHNRYVDALANAGLYGTPQHTEATKQEAEIRARFYAACLKVNPRIITIGKVSFPVLAAHILGKTHASKATIQEARARARQIVSTRNA